MPPARKGRPSSRRGSGEPGSSDRVGGALTAGGPSLLGVQGALRAREVSRPDDADAARAERLVQASYRSYPARRTPPAPAGATAADQPGRAGSSPDVS